MPIRVAAIKDHPLVLRAVVRELDGLSAKTVRSYLAGVYRKLGVNPRVAVIKKAREMGLLRQES